MSRLPESRSLAHLNDLTKGSLEVFSAGAASRVSNNKLIPITIGSTVAFKAKAIDVWPTVTDAVCLHCAEKIDKPLPAVKYYDSHEDKYWVYGFFCRPCCSLAYVQEHINTDMARCLLWTQTILKDYFGLEGRPAPPRAALQKFGGSMSFAEFYGEDGEHTEFKALHTPPFVTFAMYAEVMRNGQQAPDIVRGLRRPLIRNEPVAVHDATDKPPLILEYLAKRGAIKLKEEPKKKKQGSSLAKYMIRSDS